MFSRRSLQDLCFGIALTHFYVGNAHADVTAIGQSHCVDIDGLTQRVTQVLNEYIPQTETDRDDLDVQFQVADQQDSSTRITLIINLPDSPAALRREYQLVPEDCASAGDLLALVISDFLEELPAKHWKAPNIEPQSSPRSVATPEILTPTVTTKPTRVLRFGIGVMGTTAADIFADKTNANTELEVDAELALVSNQLAFTSAIVARVSRSNALGAGRYRSTTVLGTLGVARGHNVVLGGDLRAGALRIAGDDFEENFVQWLPWAEAAVHIGYQWKAFHFKFAVSASPFRHTVLIENRNDSIPIPSIRFGIGMQYQLGRKKL